MVSAMAYGKAFFSVITEKICDDPDLLGGLLRHNGKDWLKAFICDGVGLGRRRAALAIALAPALRKGPSTSSGVPVTPTLTLMLYQRR